MSWRFTPAFDASHRAALETGKPLVYVCPPAPWAAVPLFERLPARDGLRPWTVAVVPESTFGLDLAHVIGTVPNAAPVHVATGLARTVAVLATAPPATLVATPRDILELVGRSALKLAEVTRVVLAWPEWALEAGDVTALDTLLAEAGHSQRVVLTQDDTPLRGFLERHAHRAAMLSAARLPDSPSGPVRYLIAPLERRWGALRGVLDALNPDGAVVWDPSDAASGRPAADLPAVRLLKEGATAPLAVALDLPDASTLAVLRAAAADVVVILSGPQMAYLRKLAHPLRPLRIAGASDDARVRLFDVRQRLRERLAGTDLTGALLALEPLFDEYDPSLVAAAALSLQPSPELEASVAQSVPAFVRIRVDSGRRDQLRVGDLVGVLLNAAGLAREDLGRVDVREAFSLVEVRATVAERAVAGLSGTTVRGRRIAARLDRR